MTSRAAGQISDSLALQNYSAWTKKQSISLSFSILLFTSHHSLRFHSASCFTFPSPTTIFFPLPFLTFLHSLSLPFFPLSILPLSVFVSPYQSPSMSLFGINLKGLSWSPSFIFLFFPHFLHYFSMHNIKLPHAGRGGDSRGESERGKGKKEEEGWSSRRLRKKGFSYSMLIGSCQLQSISWCIIRVSLPSDIFAKSSSLGFPTYYFSPLTFISFPPYPLLSLFTSFCLFLPIFQLLYSLSISSLLIYRGYAVKLFHGSVGVLEVWWERPLSKSLAECYSILWSSLSFYETDPFYKKSAEPVCPSAKSPKWAGA